MKELSRAEHRKMVTRMALIGLARENGCKIARYVEDKKTQSMRAIYKIPAGD